MPLLFLDKKTSIFEFQFIFVESVSKELQPDKPEEKAVSEEEKSGKMTKAVSHSDTKDKVHEIWIRV